MNENTPPPVDGKLEALEAPATAAPLTSEQDTEEAAG